MSFAAPKSFATRGTWALLLLAFWPAVSPASPLSATERSQLTAGRPVSVLVEFESAAVDRSANTARATRRIDRDDLAILALRSQGYASIKTRVEAVATGPDAVRVRDFEHFPVSQWRLSSLAALNRLLALASVRAVHRDVVLHPVSVSDLPFIQQPQAAAEGAIGTGTTVAVIDGGLGNNYLAFQDFGTCTAVDTPASTCRVVFNKDYYPGASTVTVHGTNVSAIALGVAPGTRLAMFDVFNGDSASGADILDALDRIISLRSTYNIVAVNISLGDGSTNSSQCPDSGFASAMSSTRSAGILILAAAGNSGSKNGLGDPACVPDVVSVGAVYDAAHGSLTWPVSADPGGQCTDISAADEVTCFSQSASYLSVLAPGTLVNAPSAAFQQSGTSQATPHVTGAVAVLRARYPAESLSETLQRLQISGTADTDSANGMISPRLNLLAAANIGSAISLAGTGPTAATSGGTATYTFTVTNSGPLAATGVEIVDTLPPTATVKSTSSGCTVSAGKVTCTAGNLAVGAKVTFSITVTWNASGPVYDNAIVSADQINTSAQQSAAIGDRPDSGADVPLPWWASALLGLILFSSLARELRGRVRARPLVDTYRSF